MKCNLSEIIDIIGGGTPKTSVSEYWNGDIPWLSVKDFSSDFRYVYKTERHITQAGLEHSTTTLLQKNDTIISARGTVGELAMLPFPMAFNQSCYGLRARKNLIDPVYLYYVMKHSVRILKKNTHGSVFDTITRDTFSSIEVELPTLPVQEKIASILSALDDKIELNRRINENLEEQAQAIYQESFINYTSDNWFRGTIADLGEVVGGATPSKSKAEYYTQNGIAWITPKDLSVNKSKFIYHGAIDITESGLKHSSTCIMPKGTVLFSSRAPIGYIAIADGEVTTNQGFKSIVPFKHIGTAYVYYFLKSNLPVIEGMASGSTFKEVSGSIMKSVPTIIPDNDSLQKFNEFCTPLFEKQAQLEQENARLAALRDALLPRLMSGEIDVSNVENPLVDCRRHSP